MHLVPQPKVNIPKTPWDRVWRKIEEDFRRGKLHIRDLEQRLWTKKNRLEAQGINPFAPYRTT